jgi:hypothetical protein
MLDEPIFEFYHLNKGDSLEMVVDRWSTGVTGSTMCGDFIDLIVHFSIVSVICIGDLLGSFYLKAILVLHNGMRRG